MARHQLGDICSDGALPVGTEGYRSPGPAPDFPGGPDPGGPDAAELPLPHRPLRIGMVAPVWVPSPPPAYGGVEWLVHWLAEGMTARGHDVTLVAPGDSTSRATRVVTTYDAAPYRRMGEPLPELVHAVEAYRAVADCDVVHDHTLAGPAVGQASGLPVVHTVHGSLPAEVRRYLADLHHHCRLVAISDSQRRLSQELRWLTTVHNAIDVSSFPMREEKDDYLAFLARINPDKGIVEAIRLARALGRDLRIAAKLNEPFEVEYFRNHVQPLLGGGIEYVGELGTEDKKELLASAAALAFPIQWDEPFGLAMIEALACGTPVLAIGRGSVPEVVRDGVTGLVAADIDSLTSLARSELSRLAPAACREDAEKRFDLPRFLDDYERVYLHVANAGQAV